jgi:hypothetical protein
MLWKLVFHAGTSPSSAHLMVPHPMRAVGRRKTMTTLCPGSATHGIYGCIRSVVVWQLYRLAIVAFVLLTAALPIAGSQAADPRATSLPPAVQREAEKMRTILEGNFRACTEETIDALMAATSPDLPGLAEFREESLKMFAETDVYLRIEHFELVTYRPPFAVARVVQITLPKDEKAREAGSEPQQAYRGSTALLSEWERAVYTQMFKRSGSKWRTHGILETQSEHVPQ